jgi:RimJ/RimL family protein N-acetyltransferase
VLGPGDEDALEAFLVQHVDSSMLLRRNVRVAGIVDHGEIYQGTYVGAFDGDRIVGAACHLWRGGILLQAPVAAAELTKLAVETSGRTLTGLIGPWRQITEVRASLALAARPTRRDSREILHALPLTALVVPPLLAAGTVRCRPSHADDLPLLAAWRVAYNAEESGVADGAEARIQAEREVQHWHAEGVSFVLTENGVPVAYSAFNAALPDVVQVGGVWTPPALRSRGHGRCVVAGSLLAARETGVARAILFTAERNRPAQRAYEALGFRPVGDYGLVFFAD